MRTALALLLAALPLVAGAQQWTWTQHGYPEDGFAVEFNGIVNIRPMKLADASSRIVRGTQYVVSERTQVYTVAASLNKFGVNLFEGAQQSFARLDCGKKMAETAVDMPWGPGVELRGEHCVDGTYEAQARYHRAGPWFYQVVALYKHKGGDAASARYFVQSFRVTR
jgi:hypothetical protein